MSRIRHKRNGRDTCAVCGLMRGVRGTYWAAYNAVTDFTSHHRGRSEETRLAAQFNDGAAINDRALSTALAMAV